MSTPNKQLIAAIQRIAEGSPLFTEVRGLLKEIQRRGGIEGLSLKIGADDEAQADCCTDPNETGEPEDKGEDPNAGTIDGDRPDDGSTEKGMDGTYLMPDGTLATWDEQPCTPDDSWEIGTYWTVTVGVSTLGRAASVSGGQSIALAWAKRVYSNPCIELSSQNQNTVKWRVYDCEYNNGLAYPGASRMSCGSSTADYCQLTEAPCIEDQEWPSDGKCQEALINGRFVPHPKDPDCAGRLPQDYQIMCNADKCIAYIPTKDGGHMRVEVDPVTRLPVAGSDVKTYGSDGQFNGSNEYRYDNVKYNAYGEYSVPSNWE